MKSSISLIIPTIGRNSLKRTIESIFKGGYIDLECIIITDNSKSTKVLEILKETNFHTIKNSIIIVNKPQNPAQAKNLGILISKNKYLSFIDDDDICYSAKFHILSKYLDEHPKTFGVFGNYDVYDINNNLINTNCGGNQTISFDTLVKNNYIASGSIMYRNFKEINFIEDTPYGFGEDWLLNLKLLGKGYKIGYIEKSIYGWTMANGFTKKLKEKGVDWKKIVKQNQEKAIKLWKDKS